MTHSSHGQNRLTAPALTYNKYEYIPHSMQHEPSAGNAVRNKLRQVLSDVRTMVAVLTRTNKLGGFRP